MLQASPSCANLTEETTGSPNMTSIRALEDDASDEEKAAQASALARWERIQQIQRDCLSGNRPPIPDIDITRPVFFADNSELRPRRLRMDEVLYSKGPLVLCEARFDDEEVRHVVLFDRHTRKVLTANFQTSDIEWDRD
jgi:hypothetical protein